MALWECLAPSQGQPTTGGQETGINGAVSAGWLWAEKWPRAVLPLLQDSCKGAGVTPRLTLTECLLFSISTRISPAPVRTPGTVDSTSSPFLTKFLDVDPLTGPEQGLCVCIDSRYWFAAESFSCILDHSNSSSFCFLISFFSILVFIMSLCFCFFLLYLFIARVLKLIQGSVYRWVLEISFYPALLTRHRRAEGERNYSRQSDL